VKKALVHQVLASSFGQCVMAAIKQLNVTEKA